MKQYCEQLQIHYKIATTSDHITHARIMVCLTSDKKPYWESTIQSVQRKVQNMFAAYEKISNIHGSIQSGKLHSHGRIVSYYEIKLNNWFMIVRKEQQDTTMIFI